jgi:hypothetical protein
MSDATGKGFTHPRYSPEAELPMQQALDEVRRRTKKDWEEMQGIGQDWTVLLADEALQMLLKDLRRFRDGKPLQTKVYKILQALLKEDHRRQPRRTG